MKNNDLVKFDVLVSDLTAFVAPIKDLAVTDRGTCDKATLTLKELKFWEKKIEEKRKELVGPLNDKVKQINEYARTVLEPLAGPEQHLKSQLLAFERILEAERQEQRRLEKIEQAKREAEARAAIEKQESETRALIAKQKAEAEAAARAAKEEAEFMAMLEAPDEADALRTKAAQEAAAIEEKAMFEARQLEAAAHAEAQRTAFEATKAHWDASKEIKSNKVAGATKRWTHEVVDASLVPREYLVVDEKKAREHYMAEIKKENTPVIPGFRIFQELSIR